MELFCKSTIRNALSTPEAWFDSWIVQDFPRMGNWPHTLAAMFFPQIIYKSSANQQAAGILATIFIIHLAAIFIIPIFDQGQEFDYSNPYLKFDSNQMIND